jgi:hypothetical protein
MSTSTQNVNPDPGSRERLHKRQHGWRGAMCRLATMNNVGKVAITATAAMVSVVGITLLSPSSSPSAIARLNLTPTGSAGQQPGARRVLTEAGVRFSFRVPRGWERFSTLPTKKSPRGPISLNKSSEGAQEAEAIIYWTSFPDGDHADPCARELAPSIGRSAASLAAAVSTAPGTKLVKGPLNVTVGGYPAKHVVLTVRKKVRCYPGFFYTWREVFGGAYWRATAVGDTFRVWIVPVRGTRFFKRTRLFIAAATRDGRPTRMLKREVEQIVESFRFESVIVR